MRTGTLSNRSRWGMAVGLLAIVAQGCATANHTETGALVGTSLGALAGGIIGHQTGHTGTGAVLGAGAGMLTGAALGSAEDAREERDAAIRQAQYAEYQRNAQPPLTNADLIYMTQNGLGDQVIINAVRSRGGEFQLDPASLVQLKQSGVSDTVLAAIQTAGRSQPIVPTTHVVTAPSPRVVVVHPAPPPPTTSIHFGVGTGGPRYRYGHHHHW